jgi:hypothetical protein
MSDRFMRIEAPHFVAHAEIRHGRVSALPDECAPIIAYMRGWDGQRVRAYCLGKRWSCTVHPYPETT